VRRSCLAPLASHPTPCPLWPGLLGAGSVRFQPQETGQRALVMLVLAALFEGQQVGTRRRLKTCRNPRCRVAFYDRSRNASGVWHSVRICGNAINLRAHRERRRGQRK
jgi:predicted RNA-binding Zn ribbon-like protein